MSMTPASPEVPIRVLPCSVPLEDIRSYFSPLNLLPFTLDLSDMSILSF